ncbi:MULTISPECIES: L-threonylcarbamoyladenylate synthase [Acidobacteriaceae]|uniref:L-threonylcarbamoyladenylate synthase n=1 Tax=Acidobacteriaceae TaxID=204434 RepID=UPI00131C8467|nr:MULTISPECIES: L-threonylcarbamoyladenylate synthase [Acidobacteriaceae]MDW5265225.1 L-threonylcarbamoyladenylate synthase [Edaphobacter sp.]
MTLRLQPSEVEQAAKILREGGTVAFPTETVYGLGANALDEAAIAKIFAAKARPSWDPLIVHVSDQKMLAKVAISTPQAHNLIQRFWPGPLTLLLPRTPEVPDAITAGRPLIGVRMPSHPLALALIRAAGVPIAAPSANRFGHTSPTTADHVLEDLDGRIDAILDGGPTTVGVESTVLDPNQSPMLIYRPGAITPEMIEQVAGPVRIFQPIAAQQENPASLPSPGVGIRHYAPRAKLILVTSEEELHQQEERHAGEKIGVLLPQGWTLKPSTEVFPWASWEDGEALAQRLFAGLRDLDTRGVTTILCPLPEASGVGLAIRDRLEKAARTK